MLNRGERAGANASFWERTAQKFSTAPLQQDITVDVCVIGAGIAGVTTAYVAARENRSVVVVDDGPVGGGMTGGDEEAQHGSPQALRPVQDGPDAEAEQLPVDREGIERRGQGQ